MPSTTRQAPPPAAPQWPRAGAARPHRLAVRASGRHGRQRVRGGLCRAIPKPFEVRGQCLILVVHFVAFRRGELLGIESRKRLGRYRWIVERRLARLARFSRLTIRYERRADFHLTFTTLARALVCHAQAKRFCPCP